MHITEITVKAGRTFNHPHESYSNLRADVEFRAPAEIMERADQAAKARTIPTTRQNWLLEAILEKLEREANS